MPLIREGFFWKAKQYMLPQSPMTGTFVQFLALAFVFIPTEELNG